MQWVASLMIAAGLTLALISVVAQYSGPFRASHGGRGAGGHLDAVKPAAGLLPPPMALRDDPATGCHPWAHMGYSAEYSFTWGASFMVADEQECCEACAAHNRTCSDPANAHKRFWQASLQAGPSKCGKEGVGCNVWTYCPEERCFAFDIHNHSRHECWLKHSRAPLTPSVGSGGAFPPEMLSAPRKHWPWSVSPTVWPWPLPKQASWTSGVLAPIAARIRPQHPNMNKMFCERHPPCPSQDVAVWPPWHVHENPKPAQAGQGR